jgi:lysozyme family protein
VRDIPSKVMKMIEELVGREGGYVDHPSDRGGPTRWGITQATAREYGYTGPMRGLPREIALEIYIAIYWIKPKFDRIAQFSTRVASELFDTGVNCGTATATRFLQEALNGLNMQGKLYADIEEDCEIGPNTISAVANYFRKRDDADGVMVLLKALDSLQGAYYLTIGRKRQKNEDFMYGWLRNRIGQA